MTEFEYFLKVVRNDMENGKIKTGKPLSDYDLMIQFAIGEIGREKGYPCDVTIDEIFEKCKTLGAYANELLNEREGAEE